MSLASLPTLLLLPPLNCVVAAIAGAALYRRRVGRAVLFVSLGVLLALSVPFVSGVLIASLERDLPDRVDTADPPRAIVILAGNEREIATARRDDFTVGWLTLEREQAGARLAHASGLPVLVSGGLVRPGGPSLAALMADSLARDFGLIPKWLEARSADTWENAAFSAAILREVGIGSVYVVTHAWHMRRALMAFRAAGLRAVAAPVPLDPQPRLSLRNLVPRVSSWQESYFAIHEWVGCAWYGLRG